jgi:ABC-type bacteriocin/lantibiotic exporter with double-glycine peptidase domain
MEIFIILLILIIIGIVLFVNNEPFGVLLCGFSSVYLLTHLFLWGLASYEYNVYVVKRKAFVETLETARGNKSNYELAAISREVSEWNQDLAKAKYQNSIFFLKDYIDDRVEMLQPIR